MQDLWVGQGQTAVIVLAVAFTVGLVLLAVWIALPFGVFGTKPLLRELVAAQHETNRKLEEVCRALERIDHRPPARWTLGGDA